VRKVSPPKRSLSKPQLEIKFEADNPNYLGIFNYEFLDLFRKHARVFVHNKGNLAKNVRGIITIQNSEYTPIYLHWASQSFASSPVDPVDIEKGGHAILDIVFSQPDLEHMPLHIAEAFRVQVNPETGVYDAPPSSTIPPELMEQRDGYYDDIKERYDSMYDVFPNGCYIATNLALLSPKLYGQYYLPPRKYESILTLTGDNFEPVHCEIIIISTQNWQDLEIIK